MRKKQNNEKNRKKSSRLINWAISALLPFFTPFVYNFNISKEVQNFIVVELFMVFILYSIREIRLQIKEEKENEIIEEEKHIDEIVSRCYTAAFQLMRKKRNVMQMQTYINEGDFSENVLPYRVHDYIEYICEKLCDLVSDITSISSEFLTVTFIYRYTEVADANDTDWRWITGKDISNSVELNEFITRPDTVYYQLIHGGEPYIYIENKATAEKYYQSSRDRNFNGVGSILGSKINFSNNGTVFVEGILTISSYGKLFASSESYNSLSGERFMNVALYNVLPFFQQLIQAELGAMYLRHKARSSNCNEPSPHPCLVANS